MGEDGRLELERKYNLEQMWKGILQMYSNVVEERR